MKEDPAVQVSQVFERLGASPEQALRMSRQLVKRAEQLAGQEKIPFLESLERLMNLSVRGAQGDFDPNFEPISKKLPKS